MTKFLFRLTAVLVLLSIPAMSTDASHRGLFRERDRHVVRDRHVERGHILSRVRGGAGCAGATTGASCIGVTVTGGGCGGWTGPALAAPAVKVVPAQMPKK